MLFNKDKKGEKEKGEKGTKEFDLNIEKILENWEIYHAIREIIANALDEQYLTGTKEIQIKRGLKSSTWHIRDFGRGLNYHHLTQKENEEKLNSKGLIGKFGVGLKDALATFYRNDVKVTITSKYGVITLKQTNKEGFEDITTLHAIIAPAKDAQMIGTDFCLEGCTKDDIEKAKNLFLCFSDETVLEETDIGSVLQKPDNLPASIYINGVKVATEENFMFSYNITKQTQKIKKALNRERSNVGRTAYSDSIKQMLKSVKSKDVLEILLKDLENIQKGTNRDETNWIDVQIYAVKQLSLQNNKILFITSLEAVNDTMNVSDAKDDGYKIFVIPEKLKEKAEKIENVTTINSYLQKKSNNFVAQEIKISELTEEEKKVYDKIPMILSFMGGIPGVVKSIKITETLYSTGEGSLAVGLWEPSTGTVWIKRIQLHSVESFAETLIHECTHATSGEDDVTRRFETALSQNLGKQAAYYINKIQ